MPGEKKDAGWQPLLMIFQRFSLHCKFRLERLVIFGMIL